MKVSKWMTADVLACGKGDSMERAAQIMWDHDCGAVPVVGEGGRVEGVITDRDVAMAAYTSGQSLRALRVERAMSSSVCACEPDDGIDDALDLMARHQLHRLPVVDPEQRLVGMLSLADVIQGAHRLDGRDGRARGKWAERMLEILGEVTRPRGGPQEPVKRLAPRPLAELTA